MKEQEGRVKSRLLSNHGTLLTTFFSIRGRAGEAGSSESCRSSPSTHRRGRLAKGALSTRARESKEEQSLISIRESYLHFVPIVFRWNRMSSVVKDDLVVVEESGMLVSFDEIICLLLFFSSTSFRTIRMSKVENVETAEDSY